MVPRVAGPEAKGRGRHGAGTNRSRANAAASASTSSTWWYSCTDRHIAWDRHRGHGHRGTHDRVRGACTASTSGRAAAYPTVAASVFTVEELADPSKATFERIKHALGRNGLGIMALKGVEGLQEARQNLLPLSDAVANLCGDERVALEDPESSFNVGWSHGKETLEGGVPDTFKGSFYANPVHNKLDVTEEELRLHASYTRPNIWPASIPSLQPSLMTLGSMIVDHGKILAKVCDDLVREEVGRDIGSSSIYASISDSFAAKARLLHYFPPGAEDLDDAAAQEEHKMGNWCGWHLDHGSLTGLTSAMFTDCHGNQVSNPDPDKCGLYVKSRKGSTVRVTYTPDCLAYQVGEASQIMSGGILDATPHCVVGARGKAAAGVARNTFAVFMQPKWDLRMDPATEATDDKTVNQFKGKTFGEFARNRLEEYYQF